MLLQDSKEKIKIYIPGKSRNQGQWRNNTMANANSIGRTENQNRVTNRGLETIIVHYWAQIVHKIIIYWNFNSIYRWNRELKLEVVTEKKIINRLKGFWRKMFSWNSTLVQCEKLKGLRLFFFFSYFLTWIYKTSLSLLFWCL